MQQCQEPVWELMMHQYQKKRKIIIAEGKAVEAKIVEQYMDGLISDEERYTKLIELWEGVTRKVEKAIEKNFGTSESITDMAVSGARGSIGQLNQMAGMKGVIVNTAGRPIDFPVISSYKEGLHRLNISLQITVHEKVLLIRL
jgi:DNA-directed RNA polymerase subunit beta'